MSLLHEITWAAKQPLDFASAMLVRMLAPCFRNARESGENPWVIGGHRGRLRADNAGELHRYLLAEKKQDILWIANAPLAKTLRAQGIPVLERNTWKARLAILRAPVLIYSHGEDDLDQYAIFWRRKLGFRVHLNHCMNHLKAGQFFRTDIQKFNPIQMAIFKWTMIDFDLLPASSHLEKHNFELSMPHKKNQIVVGGGAHIDGVLRDSKVDHDGRILWFPTFRDTKEEANALADTIAQVVHDSKLTEWLLQEQRILYICHHINSKSSAVPLTLSEDSPIRFCTPATLGEHLARAELFISDYSGILADWLATDRAVLHFPFDIQTYLQSRRLYVNYLDFAYGPLAMSSEELVEILSQGSWKSLDSFQAIRAQWKDKFFPYSNPVYAEKTYQTICLHHKAT